jgi:hypothetical protein
MCISNDFPITILMLYILLLYIYVMKVFHVQQTTNDEILKPNKKCRHLQGHRGQVTTLLVVVDEAQVFKTNKKKIFVLFIYSYLTINIIIPHIYIYMYICSYVYIHIYNMYVNILYKNNNNSL